MKIRSKWQWFKEVLQSCVVSKGVKVETLPTFDIEYLFLYVRGKSVGEEIEVKILCEDDGETEVTVNIDLDDIKVINRKIIPINLRLMNL